MIRSSNLITAQEVAGLNPAMVTNKNKKTTEFQWFFYALQCLFY